MDNYIIFSLSDVIRQMMYKRQRENKDMRMRDATLEKSYKKYHCRVFRTGKNCIICGFALVPEERNVCLSCERKQTKIANPC